MKVVLSNRLIRLRNELSDVIAGWKLNVPMLAIVLWLAMCAPAWPQLSISIGLPSVSIGINVPVYPNLVPIPGYPVYYDPRLDSNLFFYDGLYWVYAQDNWYVSSWYDGPWELVEPEVVPDFILRIPVRYYRVLPPYFLRWNREAPPRWGEHWGRDWDDRRRGWDHWDRSFIPERAPLPTYQRHYPHDRYPRVDQQQTLRERNYRYQPREDVDRRHFEQPPGHPREPDRVPTAPKQPGAPPNFSRGNRPSPADHPPAVDLRRLPRAPGGDSADGQRSVPDRRPHGQPDKPNAPQAGGGTARPQTSQLDRSAPQRGAPGVPQPQRHRDQDSPRRDSPPKQPPTDKPPG